MHRSDFAVERMRWKLVFAGGVGCIIVANTHNETLKLALRHTPLNDFYTVIVTYPTRGTPSKALLDSLESRPQRFEFMPHENLHQAAAMYRELSVPRRLHDMEEDGIKTRLPVLLATDPVSVLNGYVAGDTIEFEDEMYRVE